MGGISLRSASDSSIRWARLGLVVSAFLLALAPLFIESPYSFVSNTLSQAGAQGLDGAWVFRSGVLLAAVSVLVMTTHPLWRGTPAGWMRGYVVALVFLALFPVSPPDGSAHNETVALIHTVFGLVGVISFILGAAAVNRSRPETRLVPRSFDWLVIAAVALVPPAVFAVEFDGVLQRVMVGLGYVWLIAESTRMISSSTEKRRAPSSDRGIYREC